MINPILKDQKSAFEAQFAGMTTTEFSYDDYENTRHQLVKLINQSFTEDDKTLIYSFEKGNPDWELFPYEVIKDLPAVHWKLLNINKLIKGNPRKHELLVLALENVLF